jgi:hypothetical protein
MTAASNRTSPATTQIAKSAAQTISFLRIVEVCDFLDECGAQLARLLVIAAFKIGHACVETVAGALDRRPAVDRISVTSFHVFLCFASSWPSGGGFGYDLEAAELYERPDIVATRIVWLDPIEGTARELLGEAEGEATKTETKTEQAKLFLKAALANGERPQNAIRQEAEAEGISWWTLRNAAKAGIRKRKDGHGGWFWQLI